MFSKLAGAIGLAGILMTFGAISTNSAGDEVPFPDGFRDWFAVNSMIVTKDSPMFGQIGGMHIIYVNAKGLGTLKSGGPFPYPDGTIFADDVHEFSVKRWFVRGRGQESGDRNGKGCEEILDEWGMGIPGLAGRRHVEATGARRRPCHASLLRLPYAAERPGLYVFNLYSVIRRGSGVAGLEPVLFLAHAIKVQE